jgi:DNA-binding MarR family transcriptional regulator
MKGVEQMQLEECVNYLLTTAQHSVFLKMTEKLSAFEITPVQYAVLYCLWENDKRSPKEIAERLKLENSTISGILERMEKKELIKRSISKEDRRFIQVILTKKGASLKEDVLATVEQVNNEVLSIFTAEECDQLKKILRTLAGVEL